jgi:hypothetical protein
MGDAHKLVELESCIDEAVDKVCGYVGQICANLQVMISQPFALGTKTHAGACGKAATVNRYRAIG